jgi:glucokinase
MTVRAAIGIDVGGTSTKGGVVDRMGRVMSRFEIPTDSNAGTKSVLSVAETLLRRAPDLEVAIHSVGVGAAGFVDAATGSITFSPNLVYDDPQVATAVREHVGLPVMVDNDANVAAWGEYRFGGARGATHIALLTLGTGIGSGFIIDGEILRGHSGAGAELGHMVIDPTGPECPCGLRGCFEQFASGTAIARFARQAVEQEPDSSIVTFAGTISQITAEHVAKAARELDEVARDVLRRAGRALGLGLSNVVNLFDPEVIVLGGSVVQAGEPYLGPARDELQRRMQAQRRRPMRLDVSTLGDDAGLVGAAALALDYSDNRDG